MRRVGRWAAIVLLSVLGATSARGASEDVSDLLAEAETFLYESTLYLALDRLREAAQMAPHDYRVHKVRGDVLVSFRRNQEAIAAYRQAASVAPNALDVHWALWAVLDRLGACGQAIESLKEIARLDPMNPLAHLRLAKALSQADRLEAAVPSYRRAVELEPDNLSFRLLLARALFDVLDNEGARQQVEWVLTRADSGSPEWVTARDLLAYVRGETHDKGRRFDESQTLRKAAWYTERNLRESVLVRGKGWELVGHGQYAEAEGAFRTALQLNPEDHRAMYDLGLVLMELGRYEEAIASFERGIRLTKFAEFYPDSVFQIGRCLAKLERWEAAASRFERVLEIQDWYHEDFYALNFPDLAKVRQALDEAKEHLQNTEMQAPWAASQALERLGPEPYAYPIPPLLNGHKLVDPIPFALQFAPLGTDTVGSSFRQLVTANEAIQDDLQTGLHEFLPLNPTDTFRREDAEIVLVFTLTSTQEDEVVLTSRWVAERTSGLNPNTLIGVDAVRLGLNERSGYFRLRRSDGGWKPGTYRVDLHLGEAISAYTHIAEARFRVVASQQTP